MTNPVILAIDTAQEYCSVAILSSEIRKEVSSHVGNKHAEVLLDMVGELLKEVSLTKKDITHIAFGAGPGSFTGLRVACGVAQGLSWGLGVPVVAVSNLEAQAYEANKLLKVTLGKISVLNDARMHQYYAQNFEVNGDNLIPLGVPSLINPEEAQSFIEGTSAIIGSAPFKEPQLWSVNFMGPIIESYYTKALSIAEVARKLINDGKAQKPEEVSPIYVRNKVAQTIAERRESKNANKL